MINTLEMTDGSDSDNDSVSLLHDVSVSQIRGANEDMAITDFNSPLGSKVMEKEINQLKSDEPGMSTSIQLTAGCREPSRLANVSHCVKIPNKMNLHKRNGKGETLLHKACKRKNLAQVRMLIHAGISVDTQDYAGWTALHEASAVGDVSVVEELLKAGADVHARGCGGVTPLHDAVQSGHYQVVKLLLQYGSHASDRTVEDLSALDMAQEKEITELLLTSQASSVSHETSCKVLTKYRQPGASSSEPHHHQELSCQSNISLRHGDPVIMQSSESSGRDRDSSDIQLGKKGITTDNVRYSEAIKVILELVGRKQTEMLTWPLTGLKDADKYLTALTQIQSVLIEVLTKQQLEKDNLAQKFWRVSDSLRQRVLKSQLLSHASCQKILMEILQKQKILVQAYDTMKTTQSLTNQCSLVTQLSDHNYVQMSMLEPCTPRERRVCNQDSQQRESHRSAAWAKLKRSAPGNSTKNLLTRSMKAPTVTDGQKEKAVRSQSFLPSENSLQLWLKVTLRDWPLSYHFLNAEVGLNAVQRHLEDSVEHCRAGLTTESTSLMKIKVVHLVDDEELLPNAIMDCYWDKLVMKDYSESDWESEIL